MCGVVFFTPTMSLSRATLLHHGLLSLVLTIKLPPSFSLIALHCVTNKLQCIRKYCRYISSSFTLTPRQPCLSVVQLYYITMHSSDNFIDYPSTTEHARSLPPPLSHPSPPTPLNMLLYLSTTMNQLFLFCSSDKHFFTTTPSGINIGSCSFLLLWSGIKIRLEICSTQTCKRYVDTYYFRFSHLVPAFTRANDTSK